MHGRLLASTLGKCFSQDISPIPGPGTRRRPSTSVFFCRVKFSRWFFQRSSKKTVVVIFADQDAREDASSNPRKTSSLFLWVRKHGVALPRSSKNCFLLVDGGRRAGWMRGGERAALDRPRARLVRAMCFTCLAQAISTRNLAVVYQGVVWFWVCGLCCSCRDPGDSGGRGQESAVERERRRRESCCAERKVASTLHLQVTAKMWDRCVFLKNINFILSFWLSLLPSKTDRRSETSLPPPPSFLQTMHIAFREPLYYHTW